MIMKMTMEELRNQIFSVPIPKNWRKGQFVFNRVEDLFGDVARKVQFIDRVDCFYIDSKIDDFLSQVLIRLNM